VSLLLDRQRERGRRTSLTSLVKAVATARSVASPCKKPGVQPSTSSASQPHSAVHGALTYCAPHERSDGQTHGNGKEDKKEKHVPR
jgi:hypothetical protein